MSILDTENYIIPSIGSGSACCLVDDQQIQNKIQYKTGVVILKEIEPPSSKSIESSFPCNLIVFYIYLQIL